MGQSDSSGLEGGFPFLTQGEGPLAEKLPALPGAVRADSEELVSQDAEPFRNEEDPGKISKPLHISLLFPKVR